jgi:hypothetical protein
MSIFGELAGVVWAFRLFQIRRGLHGMFQQVAAARGLDCSFPARISGETGDIWAEVYVDLQKNGAGPAMVWIVVDPVSALPVSIDPCMLEDVILELPPTREVLEAEMDKMIHRAQEYKRMAKAEEEAMFGLDGD